MKPVPFLRIAQDLELAGLIWQPEIGDEISERKHDASISILVDPQGMTPRELREVYLWLPTVEQIVHQFEARQTVLFHAGLEISDSSIMYKTVLQSRLGAIESKAESLRHSLGLALRDLLLSTGTEQLH